MYAIRSYYGIDGEPRGIGFRPRARDQRGVVAERLPDFLGDVRGHRRDQPHQRFEAETVGRGSALVLRLGGGDLVAEFAQLRHRSVETELVEVLGDRGDSYNFV